MTAQPLLHVDHLVKRFDGLTATDRASLTIDAGEIHALIGPNGAGKTTLIHQVSGALAPDAGRIVFDGADVTTMPIHRRVARGLARSYQITSTFPRLRVLDNLLLAVRASDGSCFGLWNPARQEAVLLETAAAMADRVGLSGKLDRLAGSLAHGEQRQLEMGLALATRPKLLLLDEPMAGMGPDESERMVTLLASLRGEVTMLLVEHDMEAVFRLADRISVLVFGHVIACGAPALIRQDAAVQKAYLGDEEQEVPHACAA
jgi:branched-chain amino acid transport system ATP-binding protein